MATRYNIADNSPSAYQIFIEGTDLFDYLQMHVSSQSVDDYMILINHYHLPILLIFIIISFNCMVQMYDGLPSNLLWEYLYDIYMTLCKIFLIWPDHWVTNPRPHPHRLGFLLYRHRWWTNVRQLIKISQYEV